MNSFTHLARLAYQGQTCRVAVPLPPHLPGHALSAEPSENIRGEA